MTPFLQSPQSPGLASLAAKGRAVLQAGATRAAFQDAVRAGIHALPVVPAIAVAIGLFRPLPAFVLLVCVLIAPLLSAGVVFVTKRARFAATNTAALARVDHELQLGDRAVMAEEFLRSPSPNGFQSAALDEAEPWLRGAVDRTIDIQRSNFRLERNLLVYPVAAAVLVLLAIALSGTRDGGNVGLDRNIAETGSVGAQEDARAVPTVFDRIARIAEGAGKIVGLGGTGGAGIGERSSGRSSDAQGAAGGQSGLGDAESSTAAAGQGAANAEGEAGDMTGSQPGARASGSGGVRTDTGGAIGGGTPASGLAGDAQAQNIGARNGESTERSARTAAAGERGSWPTSDANSPPGSRGGSRGSPAGSGERRSPNASQGSRSSSPGNSPSNRQGSGDGGAAGQDGAKRSRGLAMVLLGVPMEDRLVGTPSQGPSRVQMRRAEPKSGASDAEQARARPGIRGNTGRSPRPATSDQDEKLLTRYFDRSDAR